MVIVVSDEMASGENRGWRACPQRGFSLVILVVAVTVLSVGVALALPVWTTYEQREREEELIFRGLQYAEAIRVFQARNGRLPIRLEELLEVEPRVLRQLWSNPMREDGRWGLIIETGPLRGGAQGTRGGAQGAPQGVPLTPVPGRPETQPGGAGSTGGTGGAGGVGGVILSGGEGEQVQGPIRGVYDPEGLTAIKTWMGSTNTAEWQFTTDALQPQRAVAAGGGPGAGGRRGGQAQAAQGIAAGPNAGQPWPVNAGSVGRPFPPDIQVQTIAAPQQGRDLNPQNPGGNRPVQPGQPGQPVGQPGQPVGQPGQPVGGQPQPDTQGGGGDN